MFVARYFREAAPMSSNDEQIKYWNEEAGPKWVGMQAQLDAQIGPIGEKMIELAAPQPGERVLDVGCGCGMTTLALASRVAPEGARPVSISPSPCSQGRAKWRPSRASPGSSS